MISFHIYKNAKNLSAKCYQENKERIKKAHKRYQILCKEEKKQQHYGCECYKNLSEHEKQKIVECRKKYYRMRNEYFFCRNIRNFGFGSFGNSS